MGRFVAEVAEGPEAVYGPVGGAGHQEPAQAGDIQAGDAFERVDGCGVPTETQRADDAEADEVPIESGMRGQRLDDGIQATQDRARGGAAIHAAEVSSLPPSGKRCEKSNFIAEVA